MTNRQEQIVWRISDAVGADERRFQRIVGATWTQVYEADWAITRETYTLLTTTGSATGAKDISNQSAR